MQLNLLDGVVEDPQGGQSASGKKNKKKSTELMPDLFGGLPDATAPKAEIPVTENNNNKPEKLPTALKTIGEAAQQLGVEAHVLRFWESRFSQIKPLKMSGGRRYYRPEDMDILSRIQGLLHKEGYTIKGAKRVFLTIRNEAKARKEAEATTVKTVKSEAPAVVEEQKTKTSQLTDKQRKQITAIYQELLEMRGSLSNFEAA